jgi:hypothetical protein
MACLLGPVVRTRPHTKFRALIHSGGPREQAAAWDSFAASPTASQPTRPICSRACFQRWGLQDLAGCRPQTLGQGLYREGMLVTDLCRGARKVTLGSSMAVGSTAHTLTMAQPNMQSILRGFGPGPARANC